MPEPRATLRRTAIAFAFIAAAATHSPVIAGSVYVEHAGPVDISTYECREVHRSTVVRETCHQRRTERMVVLLNSSWYRYCDVTARTMAAWHDAPSMGYFFTQRIRGNHSC